MSQTTKGHTPGPWEWSHRQTSEEWWNTEVYDKQGEVIARLAWHPVEVEPGHITTDRPQNAALISAAPELLEALEEALASMDKTIFWGGQVRHPCCGGTEDEGHHGTCWTHTARAAIAKATGTTTDEGRG